MIYCTVGTTGSGKTHWVRKFAEDMNAYVIDGDQLRTMIFNGKYTYDPAVEIYLKQAAIDLANQISFLGKHVVIDDASWFLNDEDRFGLFKSEDRVTWVIFPFPTEEQVIYARKKDGRGIPISKWLEVFEEHKKRFTIPRSDNKIFVLAYQLPE